jgi:hypothetical protein
MVAGRIISVDILRGIVMVIMALDHVRDFHNVRYSPGTSRGRHPAILHALDHHFCAPTFVFSPEWARAGGRPGQPARRWRLPLTRGAGSSSPGSP